MRTFLEIHHMKRIAAAFLIIASSIANVAFAADQVEPGTASPASNTIQEGSACQDEGTLSDLQARNPFICTDGKWQKVVFKTDSRGAATPLSYTGSCTYRFVEGQSTRATIRIAAGGLADVCLPAGWAFSMVAATNTYEWQFNSPPSMPNVMLVKGITRRSKSTVWIYPIDKAGTLAEKVVVNLVAKN